MQPASVQPPPPSPMPPAVGAGEQNAFSIGRVVARTFSTWWKHVAVFSVLTLAASLPLVLLAVFAETPIQGLTAPNPNPLDPASAASPQIPQGFWLAYFGTMLLFLVEVGAITHGVINHLAGKRVSLGAMIGAGLRRAVPLLVVGVLSYLIVVLGTLLLVVPGIIFACALAVAIPAVVVERPGVLGAIKRSFALTKGKRLAVLAVFFLLFVIVLVVNVFSSFVLPALTSAVSPMIGTVLGFAVNAVFGSFFWVAPAVVYHDLRVAKEGVATAQLAAVFE